jgi:hypothetical protein
LISLIVGLVGTVCALAVVSPVALVIVLSWGILLILAALSVWAGRVAFAAHRSAGIYGVVVGTAFGLADNLKRIMTPAQRAHWVRFITHHKAPVIASSPTFLHFSPPVNYFLSIMIFAWVAAFVSSAAYRYLARTGGNSRET